jgi:hypothetical protein
LGWQQDSGEIFTKTSQEQETPTPKGGNGTTGNMIDAEYKETGKM